MPLQTALAKIKKTQFSN